MGEMGEMEKNGEIAGIAHGMWVVEGYGGMWLRKMGGKWEESGTKYPFSSSPNFPIFLKAEDLPLSSLCNNQLTALTDGKKGLFAVHRHSPPRRLMRMLGLRGREEGAQTRCPRYVDRDVAHWLMLVSKMWRCSVTKRSCSWAQERACCVHTARACASNSCMSEARAWQCACSWATEAAMASQAVELCAFWTSPVQRVWVRVGTRRGRWGGGGATCAAQHAASCHRQKQRATTFTCAAEKSTASTTGSNKGATHNLMVVDLGFQRCHSFAEGFQVCCSAAQFCFDVLCNSAVASRISHRPNAQLSHPQSLGVPLMSH